MKAPGRTGRQRDKNPFFSRNGGMNIRIIVGDIEIEGFLRDTPTALAIYDALPVKARAVRWGEEIYFNIPVRSNREEDAQIVMKPGDLAYWPDGDAFCVFFGPTPLSKGSAPIAASPVNLVGHLTGDIDSLKQAQQGDFVIVDKA